MSRSTRGVTLLVLVPALLLALVPLPAASSAEQAPDPVTLEVLSTRADLVSGGDARVRVGLPDGVDPATVRLDVDGRDVTEAFAPRPNGEVEGLLTGLAVGDNTLTATLADGSGATLEITDHPQGGPVFSGPQIQPWTCAEGALDEQCNRPPTYEHFYKRTGRSGLEPYDPDEPPSDVDTTTTNDGKTVPFIVREETGVLARDEYKIAVLFDPERPWEPWAPQDGYNGRLVITHGASCDTSYEQGSAPDVLEENMLAQGFGILSHALDNAGHNCNIVTQAESLVMTKERFVEQYGTIRWTIGSGCSGGSLTQQQVANAYPGVYQGITPACSFTDSFSSGMQKEDYNLLRRYFEDPTRWDPGVAWTPAQLQNVYGHPNLSNPITFTEVIPDNADPSRSCQGVADEDVYHHETNPDGVRCSIQDYMINVFGEREGFDDGKAGRAADNTGIQYGLSGLRSGVLTPAQFVDVNAKVGSRDVDGEFQAKRRDADRPALENAFRSGAVNTASNLDEVAIIDLRGPDPGAFHDVYRTYAMRDRLIREHGHAENQVLWRGQVALFGDVNYVDESVFAMDEWLAAVDADERDVPLSQKIVDARQTAGVDDRCTDGAGHDVPAGACDATVESYSTPRFEAGMPVADDTIKCRLKPLRREDYLPVQFTFEQWAAMRETFPDGVCDYSEPSVDKQDTIPWLTYQDDEGRVIYGGKPLGDPPESTPFSRGNRHASSDPAVRPISISPAEPSDDEDWPLQPSDRVPQPEVTGPTGDEGIRTGEPYGTTLIEMDKGWIEEEFFFEGTATAIDGDTADYKTRILVRRPADPKEFNGTVVLDWNNVTVPTDRDVAWSPTHRTLMDRGFAYVAVGAQRLGIEGAPTALKPYDPVRYGSLSHPGDDFSFDIFSQAAEVVLDPIVLGELRPHIERRLAMGASQSAGRLKTYINEVHENAGVFDGFQPQISSPADLRRDLVPVLWVNSQAEVPDDEPHPADSEQFRLWEIAGPSHTTHNSSEYFNQILLYNHSGGRTGSFDAESAGAWGYEHSPGECMNRNYYQSGYVWSAALVALDEWVRSGEPPAPAPRAARDESGTLLFDEPGNLEGGVRNPIVDVPIATYFAGTVPTGSTDPCGIAGSNVPLMGFTRVLDKESLSERYPAPGDYLKEFDTSVRRNLAAGFLLPEGADELQRRARVAADWLPTAGS